MRTMRIKFWITFILLSLTRLPFYFTKHIQEDAFISWRCAYNLAFQGEYAVNIGDRVSACTSHLYVFLAAIIHLISGPYFVAMMTAVNSMLSVLVAYLIARTIVSVALPGKDKAEGEDVSLATWLWILLALLPPVLLIGYSGMETALLLVVLGALLFLAFVQRSIWVAVPLFLLPWVRPDAIVFAGILLLVLLWRDRSLPWLNAGALIAGTVSLAAFNYFYFGNVLHHSIIAKSVAYEVTFSASRVVSGLITALVGNGSFLGAFAPLSTKYLGSIAWAFFVIVAVATFIYVRRASRAGSSADGERSLPHSARNAHSLAYLLAGWVFLPTIVYGIGGIIFPWYFWPSTTFAYVIVLAVVTNSKIFHRLGRWSKWILALGVGILALAQFLLALNWGVQGLHLKSIGEYIARNSNSYDDIMLEPMGYIPYYAKRYAHDEIGLASSRVIAYRRELGKSWWVNYVRDHQPRFLIERSRITDVGTLDGYQLSAEERAWFEQHYELVKIFSYRIEDYYSHPWLLMLLRHGSSPDYYLFARRGV